MSVYRNLCLQIMFGLAVLTLNSISQARGPGGGGMDIDQKLLERAADKLGLSDDVLNKIQNATYQADRDAIEVRAKLDRARLDFKNIMNADNPNEQKVLDLVEETGKLETTMRKNRVTLLLKVRALLTKEQRTKLKKLMRKQRKQGRKEQRGERGENRGRNQHQGGQNSQAYENMGSPEHEQSRQGGRGAHQRRR